MEFDGVQTEYQVLRDLLVGEAFGYQLQDFPLPCTQRLIERRAWCWLRRDIGLGLPDGGNRCLDALKVVRRGCGKGGNQREQVRHHLAFVGKEAQIAFWFGPSEDWPQRGKGLFCLALCVQRQREQHLHLDASAMSACPNGDVQQTLQQHLRLSER